MAAAAGAFVAALAEAQRSRACFPFGEERRDWSYLPATDRDGLPIGALAVALTVAVRARSAIYPLPVAWGLIALAAGQRTGKPLAAGVALAAAVLLLITAAAMARGGKPAPASRSIQPTPQTP